MLSGCGKSILYDPLFFKEYSNLFERESITYSYPTKIDDISVRFSTELPNTIAGRCTINIGTPLIEINISKWEYLSSEQKEILLFHELGHCVYRDSNHVLGTTAIMSKYLLSGYLGKRDELLNEYFNYFKQRR